MEKTTPIAPEETLTSSEDLIPMRNTSQSAQTDYQKSQAAPMMVPAPEINDNEKLIAPKRGA